MFVVRSYTVLHHLVVEVTCWHGSGSQESHLVYREQGPIAGDPVQALESVSDVLSSCARLAVQGELELTDECLS